MPVVRRSRTLAATPERLWDVIGDPHHLPRWWPRVSRVEAVDENAFTEVLISEKGKTVRADFHRVEEQPGRRVLWAQQIVGTPFARVLNSAETEILLSAPRDAGTSAPRDAGGLAPQDAGGSAPRDAGGLAPQDAGGSGGKPGTEPTPEFGGTDTEVTIELRQGMRGFDFSSRWGLGALTRSGSYLVRRAAIVTVEEALDGLERAVVG